MELLDLRKMPKVFGEWIMKTHGKTILEVEKAGWDVGVAWQDGRKDVSWRVCHPN